MSTAVEDEPELIDSRRVSAEDAEKGVEEDAGPSNSNDLKAKNVDMGRKDEEKPKPSKLKRIWAKLDLDLGTLMMMFK